jgi:Zn ribbon nucleic-acid-binding protein
MSRIHFNCPACGRSHDRGYLNGVDVFRCLGCGYVGHGFHPDEAIDAEIAKDIREAQAVNVALGLDAGPFAP